MLFQLYPNADGSLRRNGLPTWDIKDFVTRAHAKNVRVSIAVGGWINEIDGLQESPDCPVYAQAAKMPNRTVFVNNIVKFVDSLGLDGVDIDWEYPRGSDGWSNFIALCSELKQALAGKRISAAVSGNTPNNSNPPSVVRSGIWSALDAIHLMSYDMTGWPTHSDAGRSKQLIDAWANWGAGQPDFDRGKLIIGCAFYSFNASPGDNAESLKDKVNHCYDKGYGGVMIWELSQDLPNNTLLTAIYEATKAKGGYTGN
jgi:GH18 family chitinase